VFATEFAAAAGGGVKFVTSF